LPTVELPTAGLALGESDAAARALDAALRTGDPAVLGRMADDRLFLDCRTVLPEQVGALAKAVGAAART
jgi:L-seryl-tRNA(Ser) seleniumtransferase